MAEYLGGVVVGGFICPTDTSDTYAVTKEELGQGGFRSVANTSERLTITAERRKEGMLVHQLDTDEYWTLSGGIENTNWTLANLGGGDTSQFLLKDGTRPLAANWNIGGYKITGLGVPEESSDAVTKSYVDSLTLGLSWQSPVLKRWDPTSGLPTHNAGDRYISLATANTWTINNIYESDGVDWIETEVTESFTAWVQDEDLIYTYNGTNWVTFGSIGNHWALTNLQGGTTGEYYHLTQTQYSNLVSILNTGENGYLVKYDDSSWTYQSLIGTNNRLTIEHQEGYGRFTIFDIDTNLLPSPSAGDAGKFLVATGADTTQWQTLQGWYEYKGYAVVDPTIASPLGNTFNTINDAITYLSATPAQHASLINVTGWEYTGGISLAPFGSYVEGHIFTIQAMQYNNSKYFEINEVGGYLSPLLIYDSETVPFCDFDPIYKATVILRGFNLCIGQSSSEINYLTRRGTLVLEDCVLTGHDYLRITSYAGTQQRAVFIMKGGVFYGSLIIDTPGKYIFENVVVYGGFRTSTVSNYLIFRNCYFKDGSFVAIGEGTGGQVELNSCIVEESTGHLITGDDLSWVKIKDTTLDGRTIDPNVSLVSWDLSCDYEPATKKYVDDHSASPTDIVNIPTADLDISRVLSPNGMGGVEWRTLNKIESINGQEGPIVILNIDGLPTLETDTTKVLKPDGIGGVEWTTGGSGAVDSVNGQTGTVVLKAEDLPTSTGAAGDVLTNNGDGTVKWQAPSVVNYAQWNCLTEAPTAPADGIGIVYWMQATGNDSYTKLLLHCEGATGSSNIIDSSGSAHTITSGTAYLDQSQYKFGSSSLYFDGVGPGLSISLLNDDFNFGDDDFTIEAWIRLGSAVAPGAERAIYSQYDSATSRIYFYHTDTRLGFVIQNGGVTISGSAVVPGSTISLNTWHHVEFNRRGNIWECRFNGAFVTSVTQTLSVPTMTTAVKIGSYNGASLFKGWMDEIRVSKGISRWSSNFTPPTTPYRAAYMACKNGAGIETILSEVG